jgi:penicillin-binding protein 2
VVERVEASDGKVINAFQPTVQRQISTASESLDTWRKGMFKVANEAGGTAFDHGHVDLVQVLGKTGTAEIRTHARKKDSEERDIENWNPRRSHAWFAGWAPGPDPDLVIVVFVEHGGSGGRVAWPIAKQIIETHYAKRVVGTPSEDAVPVKVKGVNP